MLSTTGVIVATAFVVVDAHAVAVATLHIDDTLVVVTTIVVVDALIGRGQIDQDQREHRRRGG